MPEPEFGGLYAASIYGYDIQEGIKIELVSGGPGVPSAQLVASGKVEFGVLGGDKIISMREQGADLIALYASFQETPRILMSHQDIKVNDLKTLWTSGQLMAIEPGSNFVRWLNHRYGASGVKIVASQGGLGQFKQNKDLSLIHI